MTQTQIEIQLVAIVVATACAVPGVFLMLRRMSMMSDAISHAILPGIVIGFLMTGSLSSPLPVAGAAITGLLTVVLVESITRTRLIREDAAIGIVFPALFSIGVLLIARYAGDVHLDVDAVLLGELAFAPFDRQMVGSSDLGPRSLWVMGGILLFEITFISVFWKELKLATFDPGLAAALGLAPAVLHYLLMGTVSVAAVGAFDAVGSILVVALMIGPPAAAHLITDRLARLVGLSALFGAISAIGGYWLAHSLDASIAGSMAVVVGLLFGLSWLFAPERGLVAGARRRSRRRWVFAKKMLSVHLMSHEGHPEAERECRVDHLQEHLRWSSSFAGSVVRRAEQAGLVTRSGSLLQLTDDGRELAARAIEDL